MKEILTDQFIEESLNNNVLERNKKLINFIKLIIGQTENNILSLDGQWGCGKTVFAKQVEYLFKHQEKYKEICESYSIDGNTNLADQIVYYYNAWENDVVNMPVQSLIFQMLKHFNLKYEDSVDFKKTIHTLFNMITKFSYINCNDLKSENFTEKDYKRIIEDIVQIEDLKSCFNNVIDQILYEKAERLIIIIDELDRCRPSYAIEMLECMKHFYINDKITFVMVTNNLQLSKTVKKFYGSEYDGDLYLQRFYDSVITLRNKQDTKEKYISMLLGYYIQDDHFYGEIIKTCINFFGLELREINTYIRYVKVAENYIITNSDRAKDNFILLSFYFCSIAFSLNIQSKQNYNEFINGKWENIDKFISCNSSISKWFEQWDYIKKSREANVSSDKVIKNIYVSIFSNQNLYNHDNSINSISNMKKKIESVLDLIL